MLKQAFTDLDRDIAQLNFDGLQELPNVKVWMFEQADGKWTVAWVEPEPGDTSQAGAAAGPAPASPPLPAVVALSETPESSNNSAELGSLSARYESNGRPDAIGADAVGGFSYGMYQIASKVGTMARFLAFLSQSVPALAAPLTQAGGDAAARAGTLAFKEAWRTLATAATTAGAFAEAQHGFIEATHYLPLAKRVKQDLALDVGQRSKALRDVLWSVAVQHGPNTSLMKEALSGRLPATMSDAAVINAVYDERSQVDKWFAGSTAAVKAAVAQRFVDERQRALSMLA